MTWGDAARGGNSDKVKASLTCGVKHVAATDQAFAALKEDGSVIAWGETKHGRVETCASRVY